MAAVLNHRIGTRFDNTDHKKMTEHLEGRPVNATDSSNLGQAFSNDDKPVQPKEAVVEEPKKDEPPFKVPPTTAIAGVLIRDWVEGRISFPPENPPIPNRKGNL